MVPEPRAKACRGEFTSVPTKLLALRRALVTLTSCSLVAGAVTIGGSPSPAAAVTAPWDPFFAQPIIVSDFGANARPFGLAAGDFDGDGNADMVVGRTTGNVAFVKGNGDGTFAVPSVFGWKQGFFNAWAFGTGEVNDDGHLDVVWGANALSQGCSVNPVPTTGCPSTVTVNDGDVRVFFGNGDGTFQENTYFVFGVRHNSGTLLADIGTDAGSIAVGDLNADGRDDVVAGAVEGVKVLSNDGCTATTPTTCAVSVAAIPNSDFYFPAISTQNSPWGLAIGDVDADADADVWIADRALYAYLYLNDGAGSLTLKTPNAVLPTRPNVYARHDTFRAAVGYTPSLGSGDINGDGKADLALGLHSGV